MLAEQIMDEKDTHDASQSRLLNHWLHSCIFLFWAGSFFVFGLFGSIIAGQLNKESASIYQKINPNTAPAGSLIRLSGIGPSRVFDIIQYREKYAESGPVFSRPGDLQVIHGIGPKTVGKIQPWLTFEEIGFNDDKEAVDGRMGN